MTDGEDFGIDRASPSSDELLRLIFESVTDFAIFAVDARGRVTRWNTGAEQLLGFSEAEIIGEDGDVVFTPEDRAVGVPEQERSGALAKGRAEDERWHLRKNGSRFWGSGIAMPLADRSGFVKVLRDLTERRAVQERLRESEELFRLLATNIPQLVFLSSGDGERSWGSPQWIVFTGISFEGSLGFGWLDAVHPDDRQATMDAWRDARRTGDYHIEHRIRKSSDGEYRWHQTRAKRIDKVENSWVGTSTDVDDLRGLQERQKILLAELQHRTRNLLAVVQAIARQTMRDGTSAAEFAVVFEGRLRALSRIQGLLARTDHDAVDLHDLVESELMAHGSDTLGTDRITVDGPRVRLPGRTAQTLALAVHELATNAIKYGALRQPSGKLVLAWRIEEQGTSADRLVLDWRESGVAMPDPNVRAPRKGYGSELIERALPYQLEAETRLELGENGAWCTIALNIPREETGRG